MLAVWRFGHIFSSQFYLSTPDFICNAIRHTTGLQLPGFPEFVSLGLEINYATRGSPEDARVFIPLNLWNAGFHEFYPVLMLLT